MAINLILEEDEVNVILSAVAQEPFIEVVDLINKIQQQGSAQIQAAAAAAAKVDEVAVAEVPAEVPAAE